MGRGLVGQLGTCKAWLWGIIEHKPAHFCPKIVYRLILQAYVPPAKALYFSAKADIIFPEAYLNLAKRNKISSVSCGLKTQPQGGEAWGMGVWDMNFWGWLYC